jgi:RecG-like helicase
MTAARKPSQQDPIADPSQRRSAPRKDPAGKAKPARPTPLARLGLRTDWDIALHLPLRYEDETRLTPLGALRDGEIVTTDAVVIETQVQGRAPRRQLLVRLQDPEAGDAILTLRLFHFYPNQLKTLQPGVRLRVHGQVRQGLFGWEMVHPTWKLVDPTRPCRARSRRSIPPRPACRKVICARPWLERSSGWSGATPCRRRN